MKKSVKTKLCLAASFVLSGLLLFVGVMTALGWDFKKLQTVEYETKQYKITETVQSLSIKGSTGNVMILPTQEAAARVVCYEKTGVSNSVSVQDGVLTIEEAETKKWYQFLSISFEKPTVTVYLPQGEYGCISIKMSTGDISLQNLAANEVSLGLSTGDIELRGVSCHNFKAKTSTGDIELYNVLASQKMSIETSTGDVELHGCDGAELDITTSTGSVEGSLLSSKEFFVETSTGKVDVPKGTTGGKCTIHTSTGDVEITILG